MDVLLENRIKIIISFLILIMFCYNFSEIDFNYPETINFWYLNYSIHIPIRFLTPQRWGYYTLNLFFILIGFVISYYNSKDLFNKFSRLYIPYFLVLTFWFFLFKNSSSVNIEDYLKHILIIHNDNLKSAYSINPSYWFLPVVLILSVLNYFVTNNLTRFSAIIIYAIVYFFGKNYIGNFYFMHNMLTFAPYFVLGRIIAINKNRISSFISNNKISSFLILISTVSSLKIISIFNEDTRTIDFLVEMILLAFVYIFILLYQFEIKFNKIKLIKFTLIKFYQFGYFFFLIYLPLIFPVKTFLEPIVGQNRILQLIIIMPIVFFIICMVSFSSQKISSFFSSFYSQLITKNLLINFLLISISVCFTFFVIILLTQNYNINRQEYPSFNLIHRFNKNVNISYKTNGELSSMYHIKPPKHCTRETNIITDKFGFLNSTEALNHRSDIVVLGDSYSGSPSYNLCWPNLLRIYSGKNVYNLSHPGESPAQEYAQFHFEHKRIYKNKKCTIIWQLFSGNDLDDVYFEPNFSNIASFYQSNLLKRTSVFINNSILGLLKDKLLKDKKTYKPEDVFYKKDTIGEIYFLRRYIANATRSMQQINNIPNLKNIQNLILRMKKVYGRKYNLVILPLPSKEEIYHWRLNRYKSNQILKNHFSFNKVIKLFCEEHKIECIDPSTYLYGKAKYFAKYKKSLWLEDDTHMNGFGNKILVEFILGHQRN